MPNPFTPNPPTGRDNPMMTAQRPPGFMDAKQSYNGNMVNTTTQGLNPYVQFQPNRMDQMFAMLGRKRQPMGGSNMQPSHHYAPEPKQQQQVAPAEEWVDIPAQRRLSMGGPSGTVRVKRDSQAAQQTGLGVVGY